MIANRRERFTEDYAIRLQGVTLECADALYIIRSRDAESSLFYCDPPYFNSDCGHYDGYTREDFEMLLKTLSAVKGKFLLSSYNSDLLASYVAEFGWFQRSREMKVTVNAKGKNVKMKVEVLTANFPLF